MRPPEYGWILSRWFAIANLAALLFTLPMFLWWEPKNWLYYLTILLIGGVCGWQGRSAWRREQQK